MELKRDSAFQFRVLTPKDEVGEFSVDAATSKVMQGNN